MEQVQRPFDLLIYYGWLNSYNSATNQWNNEKVAQDMARYDLIVLGDGIQNPTHGDYSNTEVIIPRIMELNPNAVIFGYVTINQTLSNFRTKVDQWNDLEVGGIFLDEAGYDYGKTRDEFNERVAYVRSKTYCNRCFANAWKIEHVIGENNDPSYPDSTYNAQVNDSLLMADDWYLLESYTVNTDSYTGNGFASKSDWYTRGQKAVSTRAMYDLNMAASNIIADSDSSGQDKFDFCSRSAMAFALDAVGSSDSNYGASSAKTKMWDRPDDIGLLECDDLPTVDAGDANVYWRYGDSARIKLDWGNETSSTDNW